MLFLVSLLLRLELSMCEGASGLEGSTNTGAIEEDLNIAFRQLVTE